MPELYNPLREQWKSVINNKNHHIIVAIEDDQIVASVVCVVIPNFTNNQRPYAFIENVITKQNIEIGDLLQNV